MGNLLGGHGVFTGFCSFHFGEFTLFSFLLGRLHLLLFWGLGLHGGFFGFGFLLGCHSSKFLGLFCLSLLLLHDGGLFFTRGLGFLFLLGDLLLHGQGFGLFFGEFFLLSRHFDSLFFFECGGLFVAHFADLLFTNVGVFLSLLGDLLLHGGGFGLLFGKIFLLGYHGTFGSFLISQLFFTLCLGFLHLAFCISEG